MANEKIVWIAVISQSIEDYLYGYPLVKEDARRWLWEKSNFELVCQSLGIQAQKIRTIVLEKAKAISSTNSA